MHLFSFYPQASDVDRTLRFAPTSLYFTVEKVLRLFSWTVRCPASFSRLFAEAVTEVLRLETMKVNYRNNILLVIIWKANMFVFWIVYQTAPVLKQFLKRISKTECVPCGLLCSDHSDKIMNAVTGSFVQSQVTYCICIYRYYLCLLNNPQDFKIVFCSCYL
jgi:hypothetical protein